MKREGRFLCEASKFTIYLCMRVSYLQISRLYSRYRTVTSRQGFLMLAFITTLTFLKSSSSSCSNSWKLPICYLYIKFYSWSFSFRLIPVVEWIVVCSFFFFSLGGFSMVIDVQVYHLSIKRYLESFQGGLS